MIDTILRTLLDVENGTIDGAPLTVRRLSELRECFRDSDAYDAALAAGDPVVYTVATVEPATGDGQLHYGLATLMPGKIGDEYFLTKGHLHTWRAAAELYIGLAGNGVLLLEDELTGESRLEQLNAHCAVYVPAHTAHRTINVGSTPLVYLGVYPAGAGHDYAPIAERNFSMMVVESDGQPTLIDRTPL